MSPVIHRFLPVGKACDFMPIEYIPSNLVGLDCAALRMGMVVAFHELSSKPFKVVDQLIEVSENQFVVNHFLDMPQIRQRRPSLKLVAENPSSAGTPASPPLDTDDGQVNR